MKFSAKANFLRHKFSKRSFSDSSADRNRLDPGPGAGTTPPGVGVGHHRGGAASVGRNNASGPAAVHGGGGGGSGVNVGGGGSSSAGGGSSPSCPSRGYYNSLYEFGPKQRSTSLQANATRMHPHPSAVHRAS